MDVPFHVRCPHCGVHFDANPSPAEPAQRTGRPRAPFIDARTERRREQYRRSKHKAYLRKKENP